MSREGHKNTDLRQERTAGPCFIWLLIGLDGTCKSSSARWPEENACLLLGEGTVIILQELRQLFHIENFLSVEEDGFEGSGFLFCEGTVIILQEFSQFFHIKTPFLFEVNGGNETSEILGESLIIHPQHLSKFVPNVPFHESRPPISFVSCGFCFGIFVFPFDGLIIAPL